MFHVLGKVMIFCYTMLSEFIHVLRILAGDFQILGVKFAQQKWKI